MACNDSGDHASAIDPEIMNWMSSLELEDKNAEYVNVLLLGETGVGKTTFVNSIFNYSRYPKLWHAIDQELIAVIPSKFDVTDENFDIRTIEIGQDANECYDVGASSTQYPKAYLLPLRQGAVQIRLIDTPGIGDVRGIDQDNVNMDNVLWFISELKQINAICILLKPDVTRLTVTFTFCIKQLLSKLDKSAGKNIVFVFTNTRGTFYRPGQTYRLLRKMFEDIPGVEIPLSKDNVFCFDNESFRFLAAVENDVIFDELNIQNFSQSWDQSFSECWRMFQYIIGNRDRNHPPLKPHLVQSTISLNEARRLIIWLAKPLADIAQLVEENIIVLRRHQAKLGRNTNAKNQLEQKLFIPLIDLRVIELNQPVTVCTSAKCSQVHNVGERQMWHYGQRCHNPCYLRNVPREIMGSTELMDCWAIDHATGICNQCSCKFNVHMHVYYETEMYQTEMESKVVKEELDVVDDEERESEKVIKQIEDLMKEYQAESDFITRTIAKFAVFLQQNAIIAYNDSYHTYLQYLIDREKSLGDHSNQDQIHHLEQMLVRYNQEKSILNNAIKNAGATRVTSITAEDINTAVESLYQLKLSGNNIRKLFHAQTAARDEENRRGERDYYNYPSHWKKVSKKKNKKNSLIRDVMKSFFEKKNKF